MAARIVVALVALLLAAGCGSSKHIAQSRTPAAGTLNAFLERPGEDVSLVSGTSDYAPGSVRLSFLVVRHDGKPVFRPRARVVLATGLKARPFEHATAKLEQVAVHGGPVDPGDVTRLYVVHLTVPRPGTYWVGAEPIGGSPIQGVGNLIVRQRTDTPPLGSTAFRSETPTIASAHGDLAKLTTRTPPDTGLLRYSVAECLKQHRPFVLVFATPKFCTSRTCGPVVDIVDGVRTRFERRGIRFIHVEIYRDNNPSKGFNRWVREWRLPTEPWVFLVGRDGKIKAKFEGSLSMRELTAAVRRTLL